MKSLLKKILFISLLLFPIIAVVEAAEMEKETPLIKAIEEGKADGYILSLIQNGADVNGKGEYGYTPLMTAVNG